MRTLLKADSPDLSPAKFPPIVNQAEHLNTPRLVADSSQTTVWRWDQAEPFGVNAANEDPDGNSVAFDLPLRLPGQYYDKETGLHQNYFRDYDPSLGRYVESDPIGLDGGLNTYAYVAAAPLFIADSFGLVLPSQKPPQRPEPISGPYNAPPRTADKIADWLIDQVVKRITGIGGVVTKNPIGFGISAMVWSGGLNEGEDELIRKIKQQSVPKITIGPQPNFCTPDRT